jgi:ADP-ribosylglycohydrolase
LPQRSFWDERPFFLGGDADTLACMAGGIAEAYYKKLPARIVRRARRILGKELLAIMDEFSDRYGLKIVS